MRPSLWPRGEPTDKTRRATLNFASSREEAEGGENSACAALCRWQSGHQSWKDVLGLSFTH